MNKLQIIIISQEPKFQITTFKLKFDGWSLSRFFFAGGYLLCPVKPAILIIIKIETKRLPRACEL